MKEIFRGAADQAAAPMHSKGVMLRISKKLQWSVDNTITDPGGWYIILFGQLDQSKLTIAGIYAPNGNQIEFWNIFCSWLYENVQGVRRFQCSCWL